MKKNVFYLTLLSLILIFTGCQQPTDNTAAVDGNTPAYSQAQINLLKKVYATLVGTAWKNSNEFDGSHEIESASFADDSVTFNNVQYSLNQNTDLFFKKETTDENIKKIADYGIYIKIENRDYLISEWLFCGDDLGHEDNYLVIACNDGTEVKRDWLKLTSSAGSTDDISSVNGSYAFNDATGSQINGTLSLSDGTWSYSGSKTNPAASSGTYTVNGSKITVEWTANGYEVSETFTVSTSDSSSTWTSENTGVSTFFSMLFNVADSLSMTFSFAE